MRTIHAKASDFKRETKAVTVHVQKPRQQGAMMIGTYDLKSKAFVVTQIL